MNKFRSGELVTLKREAYISKLANNDYLVFNARANDPWEHQQRGKPIASVDLTEALFVLLGLSPKSQEFIRGLDPLQKSVLFEKDKLVLVVDGAVPKKPVSLAETITVLAARQHMWFYKIFADSKLYWVNENALEKVCKL